MKEIEWAKEVANKLNSALQRVDSSLHAIAGKKLIYANEIREYNDSDTPNSTNTMEYETDILVFQCNNNELYKPRVVIETKIQRITTHDAITYSQKASTHKYVHPYLRYGIFLGKRDHHPLPGRLFRHGAHFDFMLSWQGYDSTNTEWESLLEIVKSEVKSSQKLEKMIFDSRSKNRTKYTILHKPLITE